MITGALLRDAVVYASQQMSARQQEIDALNVFPVPDGDTGTNMSMTLLSAAREMSRFADGTSLSAVADGVAAALLQGARGNSGVILSLIFRGFAKELQEQISADGAALAAALRNGTEMAYKAVMTPVEGTILTVVRKASEAAKRQLGRGNDATAVFSAALRGAREALADTPNLLPILKKANVVDAGGQGLVVIFEAMLAVFQGQPLRSVAANLAQPAAPAVPAAVQDMDIMYTYCTEFLIQDAKPEAAQSLRETLAALGDSFVFLAQDALVKVHIHTNEPDKVLAAALGCGSLDKIKIENMRVQHTQTLEAAAQDVPEAAFGLVAVAAGAGLKELFGALGAGAVVSGGQTMNPSTQELLQAVESIAAKRIFLLPNNRNIIMAAEQAAALSEKAVTVIPSETVPQGIAAALALDEDSGAAQNDAAMRGALTMVSTGLVTFAAQTRDFAGLRLKRGDIIGMENGELSCTAKTHGKAAVQVAKSLFSAEQHSSVTLYYGAGVVHEEAEAAAHTLREMLDAAEVSVIDGGQPIYYYIISVE